MSDNDCEFNWFCARLCTLLLYNIPGIIISTQLPINTLTITDEYTNKWLTNHKFPTTFDEILAALRIEVNCSNTHCFTETIDTNLTRSKIYSPQHEMNFILQNKFSIDCFHWEYFCETYYFTKLTTAYFTKNFILFKLTICFYLTNC